MRHRIYPFVILGALIASGCSGGGGTPHTTTSPTPSASASASASPSPSASASASPTPSPTGSAEITATGLYVSAPYPNSFTQVTTTLTVPPEPPATGAVIIWPGLFPCCSGSNPTLLPIDVGTLQPELSWGTTFAPTTQPAAYSTWWISGQYNNFAGSETGYIGYHSGNAISVSPGDSLVETLTLSGTVWNEQITDENTSQSTSFQIDLLGQTQNELFFFLQGNGQNPVGPVSFTNTSFTTSTPFSSAAACELATAGTFENDTQSTPTLNGNTCSIANITLLPAASSVPAFRNRGPAAAIRFPAPPIPPILRKN